MDSFLNIYKKNLEILSNVQDGETIYYEENRIFIDTRYFSQFRYGNNSAKILEIIKISFLHFYNQLLMNLCSSQQFDEIYNFLNKSIEGLTNIKNIQTEDKNKYDSLVRELSNLLEDIKKVEDKDFYSESSSDESESDIKNCLDNMIHRSRKSLKFDDNNIIFNTVYVLKNQLIKIIFIMGNTIYNIVNF